MKNYLLLLLFTAVMSTGCKKDKKSEEAFTITARTVNSAYSERGVTLIVIKGENNLPADLHQSYSLSVNNDPDFSRYISYAYKSQTEFELQVSALASAPNITLSFNTAVGKQLKLIIPKTAELSTYILK